MADEMSYRFTLEPMTVSGEVGGDAHMRMAIPGMITIMGREDFDNLISVIERLRDEVSAVNSYKGVWGVKYTKPEADDGVLL